MIGKTISDCLVRNRTANPRSGVVAVMGSPEQTSTVNMIPTTRKLAGIMGRLGQAAMQKQLIPTIR